MEDKGGLRGLVSAGWIEVGERMSAISKEAESRDLTITDMCRGSAIRLRVSEAAEAAVGGAGNSQTMALTLDYP